MSKSSLLIVDYGLGNLFNIQAAFESLGFSSSISRGPEDIAMADRIIIPGVGSFADGMKGLQERELAPAIQDSAKKGKPILGICLGMQLMLSESEEWGNHRGLDLVPGKVVPLKMPRVGDTFKIPHIGWNTLQITKKSKLFDDIALSGNNEFFMYFLHSFYAKVSDQTLVGAETLYGADRFCAFFEKDNLFGFQPHPERSGVNGLQIFRNFMKV